MLSRAEEREILDNIKRIIDETGSDSILYASFNGFYDLASDNIRDDTVYSMQDRLLSLKKELQKLAEEKSDLSERCEDLSVRISSLGMRLETEEEWQDYESEYEVSNSDYMELLADPGIQKLSEGEAASLISSEFGFNENSIEILYFAPVYQINRHRILRHVGENSRYPLYFATDMNYVRFSVNRMTYELYNGELRII